MEPRFRDFWKRRWFWSMVAAGAIASIGVRLFWAWAIGPKSASDLMM